MKYKLTVTWKNDEQVWTDLTRKDAKIMEDIYESSPYVLAVKIERDYGV